MLLLVGQVATHQQGREAVQEVDYRQMFGGLAKWVIEIDDTEHLLGVGDFVGFPAASAPHQLKNPLSKSLVCLMGGERHDVDISDFPREGKRMFRHGDRMELYDTADAEETGPANLDEIVTTNYRKSLNKD